MWREVQVLVVVVVVVGVMVVGAAKVRIPAAEAGDARGRRWPFRFCWAGRQNRARVARAQFGRVGLGSEGLSWEVFVCWIAW